MRGKKFMIYTYTSGEVVEKSMFAVGSNTKTDTRRRRVKGSTPPKKQDLNAKAAVKVLARRINSTFKKGDALCTLRYTPEQMKKILDDIAKKGLEPTQGEIEAACDRELNRCLDRVEYALKKRGVELNCLIVTSTMDGDTGEDVRPHHHVIVNKAARDELIKQWGFDKMNVQHLDNRKDHSKLAAYLLRQVKHKPDRKKWRKRGKIRIEKKERITIEVYKMLRPPPGALVTFRSEYDPETGADYIRFIKPPPRKKHGGKRD